MYRNTVIRARVSESEKLKFEILADHKKLTVSELIRETLNEMFDEEFTVVTFESEEKKNEKV